MTNLDQVINSYLSISMRVKNSPFDLSHGNFLIKKSGHTIIFHISVENITDKYIKHALIKCSLPSHLRFHKITNRELGHSFYSIISNSIIWDIPMLKENQIKALDFATHIMPGIAVGSYIDVFCRILEFQIDDKIVSDFRTNPVAKIKLYKV